MLSVKLGIEHHVELKTQDGFFSVDCAFKSGNRRIAIEVDGPSHFTVNTNRPLGHTVLRCPLVTPPSSALTGHLRSHCSISSRPK
jgi:hypothetical protein